MSLRKKINWYRKNLEYEQNAARAAIMAQYEPLFKMARDEIITAESNLLILRAEEPLISRLLRIFCISSKWWMSNLARPIQELAELRDGLKRISSECNARIIESNLAIERTRREASLKRIRDKEIDDLVNKTVARALRMVDQERSVILRNQCGYLKKIMILKQRDRFGFVVCFYCKTRVSGCNYHRFNWLGSESV